MKGEEGEKKRKKKKEKVKDWEPLSFEGRKPEVNLPSGIQCMSQPSSPSHLLRYGEYCCLTPPPNSSTPLLDFRLQPIHSRGCFNFCSRGCFNWGLLKFGLHHTPYTIPTNGQQKNNISLCSRKGGGAFFKARMHATAQNRPYGKRHRLNWLIYFQTN